MIKETAGAKLKSLFQVQNEIVGERRAEHGTEKTKY